ncbi:predicted protein [Sclerotinia sclerotiorum 1980 UF-70]|uniref:Uncharacterized protein n=1 Tax=Sclerotinia sclerotiorum (strain ATCC 18683 / 1980 / Ss-1) TaxID=665079 RepID=A7F601_SCLS1|nr:predicted protein [Sclerotinia sclerotiorum 1980 UF-70]EDN98172.1 predicted protein [Sclerotinia sclerotiorum 1980 UF-70]
MGSNGQDLLDRCQAASNEAISKSNNLTSFIADSRQQLLGASNSFFGELLDLAVAIRGNYDKTALTPPIANIVDDKLIPTLNEAKERQASMIAQAEYASRAASTSQDSANQAQETANAAQHELENAQRRLSDDEDAATGAQIGTVFAWIFCPPAGAALQFTVVQQARDRVNDARNNLNNAVGNVMARNQEVAAARIRQAEAEHRLMEINNALATMPSLLSVAEATRAHCEELRTPIIALKKQQDELADLLGDMQNAASIAKLDTRKKALASDILKVISMGLIDMTLITPAKAVQDELCNNDDEKKSVTVELAEQLKALEAAEAAINTAQLHLSSA